MKKISLLTCFAISSTFLNAQHVFEKHVYPKNIDGDLELKDVLIATNSDSSDIISTGYYIYGEDSTFQTNHAVLVSHDTSETLNYAYDYVAFDPSSNAYNTNSNSIAQDSSGYFMVGEVNDNSYHGSTANGGMDILIIKCNRLGGVVSSKRIDIGGMDVAYSIKATSLNSGKFLVCGASTKTNGSIRSFIMEIDNNLNINWLSQMDLRLSSGTTTFSEIYDITTDGSSIWGVGAIRNNGSLNRDGLVVKLNNSGVYQTSRRVYNGTDREVFYHVEMDGSNLIIAGDTKKRVFVNANSRMLAMQYNTASNTVTKAFWLKSGLSTDVGHDIIKTNVNGTINYYVVGEAIPSTGNNKGVLYKLNSSFLPIKHVRYSGSGNAGLYAIDTKDAGASSYLGTVGYSSGSNLNGYVLKTNLNGTTGCSDTISIDSLRINYNVASLLDSIDTTYTTYTPTIERDTLIDSLFCSDTTAAKYLRNKFSGIEIQDKDFVIYPNPVENGRNLNVRFESGIEVKEISIYNILGKLVAYQTGEIEKQLYMLSTKNLTSGMYIIHINALDNEGNICTKEYKVMVE